MNWLEEFKKNPEFMKLQDIGGHRVYHLEGNALVHTEMVYAEAEKMFGNDDLMLKAAALHDIGKIYTSIRHGEGNWEYPDHSTCGALRGILCKFISEEDPDFTSVQWYIRHHIRPLHWKGNKCLTRELNNLEKLAPTECSVSNLIKLALCDIKGSISIKKDDCTSEFLLGLLSDIRN